MREQIEEEKKKVEKILKHYNCETGFSFLKKSTFSYYEIVSSEVIYGNPQVDRRVRSS